MADLQRKLQEEEKSCFVRLRPSETLQTELDSITLTFLEAGSYVWHPFAEQVCERAVKMNHSLFS